MKACGLEFRSLALPQMPNRYGSPPWNPSKQEAEMGELARLTEQVSCGFKWGDLDALLKVESTKQSRKALSNIKCWPPHLHLQLYGRHPATQVVTLVETLRMKAKESCMECVELRYFLSYTSNAWPSQKTSKETQRAEQESQESWTNRKLRDSKIVLHVNLEASFILPLPLQAVLNINSYISNI